MFVMFSATSGSTVASGQLNASCNAREGVCVVIMSSGGSMPPQTTSNIGVNGENLCVMIGMFMLIITPALPLIVTTKDVTVWKVQLQKCQQFLAIASCGI